MKNLFKKDSPEGRVQAEIQSTEFKKNSMISAVNAEKNMLEQQKANTMRDIGDVAYRQYKAQEEGYDFQAYFAQLEQIDGQIQEKDQKIHEITSRYDEEISLLSATLASIIQTQASMANPAPMVAPPVIPASPVMAPGAVPPPVPGTAAFCENCGKPSSLGDAFCQNCGKPLS